MAFIEKTDLLSYITEDNLDQIIDNDDSKLSDPIADALAFIKANIDHRYNVEIIFGASGASRNKVIKKIAIDIALFYAHSLINPRNIPELRGINHDQALKHLNMIRRGEMCTDLPLRTPEEDITGMVRYGTSTRNSNTY